MNKSFNHFVKSRFEKHEARTCLLLRAEYHPSSSSSVSAFRLCVLKNWNIKEEKVTFRSSFLRKSDLIKAYGWKCSHTLASSSKIRPFDVTELEVSVTPWGLFWSRFLRLPLAQAVISKHAYFSTVTISSCSSSPLGHFTNDVTVRRSIVTRSSFSWGCK